VQPVRSPPEPNTGRGAPDDRGRSAHGPVRLADALGALASRLGAGRTEVVGIIFNRWEDIVGTAVAAHIRPVRIVGTTLVLHADHPAWATHIRLLAPDILGALSRECAPNDVPERIEVRVRR
jgi:predicted nucleic acid-binding Zn ribbon protein